MKLYHFVMAAVDRLRYSEKPERRGKPDPRYAHAYVAAESAEEARELMLRALPGWTSATLAAQVAPEAPEGSPAGLLYTNWTRHLK